MSQSQPENEFERLKRRIEAGDAAEKRRALDDLIARYWPMIERHAHRVFFDQLRPTTDSQEITHMVFLKLADRLSRGRIELLSEKQTVALLKRMVEQKLIDAGRRRHPGRSLDEEPPDGPRPEPPATTRTGSKYLAEDERRELVRDLSNQVRARLQPDEWHLFRRFFFEDATYGEIAAEVGSTENAVRMRMKRIRDGLVKRFQVFEHILDQEP